MTKHINNNSGRGVLAVLAMAAPGLVLAQVPAPSQEEEQRVQYGGSLFLEAASVQNANRTAVEDDEISEVQAEYGAEVFASVDRELVELEADYSFDQNEFLEDTQDDRFIYTGQSAVTLGTENTFWQLEAAHSVQRFLANPAGPAILDNTDQRNITSVAPLLRLQPSQVDSIAVQGSYVDTRYKELDFNDSERIGAGLIWLRRASPIYTYGLRAFENEVDYRVGEAADYKYRRAAFMFEGDLRLLDYTFSVGMNEAAPEVGSSVDELYYDIDITYGQYRNTWSVTAERSITDTSLGNANDPFFSEGITSDASNLVQDQLERHSYGFLWSSNFLCERCDLGLRVGYEEENYFNVVSENQDEAFAGALLSYMLRPEINLELVLDYRLRDFADGGRVDDYSESSALVAVDFSEVFRQFETRVWFDYMVRDPTTGSSYSTNAVGITLAYEFGQQVE